jgi:hypothetical protein
LPLRNSGLIVNADSMLVRNPASLGVENQPTKCVKMFRSNCIDFSPPTTYYYAYSTINAPDNKGEVGGSSPPRPTILFSRLPDVAPKSSTPNPTHTYLRSPRERRSDSWRGEIFYSCRRNHLEPKRITERAPRRRLSWRSPRRC